MDGMDGGRASVSGLQWSASVMVFGGVEWGKRLCGYRVGWVFFSPSLRLCMDEFCRVFRFVSLGLGRALFVQAKELSEGYMP